MWLKIGSLAGHKFQGQEEWDLKLQALVYDALGGGVPESEAWSGGTASLEAWSDHSDRAGRVMHGFLNGLV